jgi:hypothetical protein
MIPTNRDHHAFCGMVAGLLATAVLSAAMSVMVGAGLAPDIIGLISHTLRSGRDTGWIVHFLVGTVAWGGFFAILQPFLPSRSILVRGMMFSVAAWLAMMLILMPIADAGYFGLSLGWTTPFTTLLLHLIFGATLGLVCSLLPLPDYERGEAGMLRRGHH